MKMARKKQGLHATSTVPFFLSFACKGSSLPASVALAYFDVVYGQKESGGLPSGSPPRTRAPSIGCSWGPLANWRRPARDAWALGRLAREGGQAGRVHAGTQERTQDVPRVWTLQGSTFQASDYGLCGGAML